MVKRLYATDSNFEADFSQLLSEKREVSQEVDYDVTKILSAVQTEGDAALVRLSKTLDGIDFNEIALRVSPDDVQSAVSACSESVLTALKFAHERITSHHKRQIPKDDSYVDDLGVSLGSRWTPVESVGLYVPGGLASYPSSVLMNAVPAKVAGVPRIAMVVPSPRGVLNPMVLVAAHIAGIEEIYRVGGAQAIAALAYGTESIPSVVKIVGPGNAYVAAAKRHVFGTVGIDSIAGPSEVLVIADDGNDPDWVAADLLAQAEHDTAAQSILITDSDEFANAVEAAVERQLKDLNRADIASQSWRTFGCVIVVPSLEQVPPLADRIAAEHLEILTQDPELMAGKIRNAGAIFLGAYTPEVIGDYVSGSNHVLPTARSAKYASGLGTLDFMKRTSILRLDEQALFKLAPPAMALADVEGLDAHRQSVAVRLKNTESQAQNE